MTLHRGISVGRRLTALIAAHVATAIVLLVVGLGAFGRIATDLAFTRRFVLAPHEGIVAAMEEAARLQWAAEAAREPPPWPRDVAVMQGSVGDVGRFLDRYRSEWATADNISEDADRFRADLAAAGRGDLVAEERAAMRDISSSLDRIRQALGAGVEERRAASLVSESGNLRTALRRLLRVNVAFADLEATSLDRRSRETAQQMAVLGLIGILGSLALGIHVRQAIAPRIRRLVQEVHRFKELGVHEPVPDKGSDEIAILANAIDAGFTAIAARDRERERFLAVVAHELKTPMTSILGFTELALGRPEEREVRMRALDLVRMHASRLGRLIDDLLLAASTRSGELPFRPESVDLGAVVERAAAEVATVMPGRSFEVDVTRRRHLLVDERLLSQAVWSLLTYAGAIANSGSTVQVRLEPAGARMRVQVVFDAPLVDAEDIAHAYLPFASVQYEGGSGIRTAVGLFLCREIARVHGGTLLATNVTDGQRMIVLDLPA